MTSTPTTSDKPHTPRSPRRWREVLLRSVACTVALCSSTAAGDEPRLTPAQPLTARKSNPVTTQVDFRAIVTPPYRCQLLKVWLPLPPSDETQELSEPGFETFPVAVEPRIETEPRFGNRFAYFEFHQPQGAQIITHRFSARIWELHWDIDADNVQMPEQWPAAFDPYLQPRLLRRQDELSEIVQTLLPRRSNPAADLRAVIDWVDANLTYDHEQASLQADPDHALELRRGHCSDYHGLCAAMGQALGYPTRVTYGLNLYPKNSPSHCKLEVYLPPYGWVSFDVSETQNFVARIERDQSVPAERRPALIRAARERLYRGFRENSWLLVTRGTDYELAPPAAQPVRVVRTIHAEADGVALPEPDPANPHAREFAWMTAHRFISDTPLSQPFHDWRTLDAATAP